MNPDNLIIEDFDFLQYPIARTYQLGGKTVIQIGEPISEKPKKSLFDEIDSLKGDLKVLEEEKESAESELEKVEKQLADTEEKHEEYLHKIDCALESAEFDLKIDTESRHSFDRIAELTNKIILKFESAEEERDNLEEEIRGLQVDNRALASTIESQDRTIDELTEKLTRWETAYPHG